MFLANLIGNLMDLRFQIMVKVLYEVAIAFGPHTVRTLAIKLKTPFQCDLMVRYKQSDIRRSIPSQNEDDMPCQQPIN